ncbi:MAG: amphi-Trp domain-containing protein [Desulfonauticus sp.]|nr:amphi-Trp domain-containing protein [Desulfonauticus sp.]
MAKELKFEYKSLQDVNSIQDYFKALLTCFENKHMVLSSANKTVEFPIGELIELGIKAKKKDGEVKITIKLEWKDKNTLSIDKEDKLNISS